MTVVTDTGPLQGHGPFVVSDEDPVVGGAEQQNVRVIDAVELRGLGRSEINGWLCAKRSSYQQVVEIVVRLKAYAHRRWPAASRALWSLA